MGSFLDLLLQSGVLALDLLSLLGFEGCIGLRQALIMSREDLNCEQRGIGRTGLAYTDAGDRNPGRHLYGG